MPEKSLVSRNICIDDRRTSIRLEAEMWSALREIARLEKCTIHDICSLINTKKKPESSLTASVRVYLMLYYRNATTPEGHKNAGHGNIINSIIKTANNLNYHIWSPVLRTQILGRYRADCISGVDGE